MTNANVITPKVNTLNMLGIELLSTRNTEISLTIIEHSSDYIRTKAEARLRYFASKA